MCVSNVNHDYLLDYLDYILYMQNEVPGKTQHTSSHEYKNLTSKIVMFRMQFCTLTHLPQ